MFERIKNMALLLLVFLLPWQTRLILRQDTVGYFEISVYAIDLILIILLSISLINAKCPSAAEAGKNQKSKIKISNQNIKRILMIVSLFLLWNGLSIIWASDKILAMQHTLWLALAMGLVWLVVMYEDKAKLIFWFVMGLMVSSWLGIWQFVTQTIFANKWLGLAAHETALGGTSVVETVINGSPARWLRAYGSFDHPNIFGMMMAIGILLVIGLSTRTVRNESKNSEAASSLFRYLALVSMTAGLFVSLSRSAWLGLAIGLSGIGFFLLRSALRNKKVKCGELFSGFGNYFKAIVIVVVVFLMLGFVYRDVVMVRTNNDARLEKKSLDDRALYFQQAKEIIKQHQFIGVGAGNYVQSLTKNNPGKSAWIYQPVHNVYMLMWAELGLVGLLTFVVIYVTIIIRAYKNSPLGFCLLISILPAMIFDHWLWSLHFGLLFIGLVIGLVLNKRLETM